MGGCREDDDVVQAVAGVVALFAVGVGGWMRAGAPTVAGPPAGFGGVPWTTDVVPWVFRVLWPYWHDACASVWALAGQWNWARWSIAVAATALAWAVWTRAVIGPLVRLASRVLVQEERGHGDQ